MSALIVVDQPRDWPLDIPGAPVVAAREYLTDPQYVERRGLRVFNLCRSYRYQSAGYYVSLLAAARGHRPTPSIETLQAFRNPARLQVLSDDFDHLIERSLKPLLSDEFTLSIYFGRNVAERYAALARRLFDELPAPFLRAEFRREEDGWELKRLAPIDAGAIPVEHRDFAVAAAQEHFAGRRRRSRRNQQARYDLAMLVEPNAEQPPSDAVALRRFERAAERAGFDVEVITREDFGSIGEFDALFIRATTAVNHYTFRFAQRAEAQGLVVVDDPQSILRCTNKVYLAELLHRHRVLAPRTLMLHRRNCAQVLAELGLPCVLKQPDSAFSKGVVKVDTAEAMQRKSEELLEDSELIIAQEFLPTSFDWRVGVFDGRALYACRYYMARSHWQILKHAPSGKVDVGRFDTLAIADAPRHVVQTALRAANLFGRGLYGVDLKEVDGRAYVIEVNDNPSIDGGVEDKVLRGALYDNIMTTLMERVEARKARESAL